MKVLFAVSNENISDSIIKKYQQEYREIISSKNVYYFNAIIKELQKDKSYDRIVISEDLEPFANNNYEVIDKFIFEKLDNISDEATSSDGTDIPIILICADRRVKSENLLVKLFGIGVYSALLGQDRSITNVCTLINKPRSKKDAKVYYRIDSDNVEYRSENEGDVSEVEIQNILNHYKRLGKNEEKYVESFDSIAAQYTDAQLRVICKFLPLNVKAVLESYSQKYQELITFGTVTPSISIKGKSKDSTKYKPNSDYYEQKEAKASNNLDIIQKNIGKSNLTRPVIIPSSLNVSNVKKVNKSIENIQNNMSDMMVQQPNQNVQEDVQEKGESIQFDMKVQQQYQEQRDIEPFNDILETTIEEPAKKKRGRPKKIQPQAEESILPGFETVNIHENSQRVEETVKKKRGRPKKVQPQIEENTSMPGVEELKEDDVNLFGLADEEPVNETSQGETTGGIILPGFEENESDEPINDIVESFNQLPGMEEKREETSHSTYVPPSYSSYQQQYNQNRQVENVNQYQVNTDFNSLLTRDKKIVAFVGTSKNGTSFLVNNLADVLSKKGINTAILDLTKNKNAYYIYTQNEESLRKKAFNCISNLRNGIADGIQINKNLTVFTTLPEENPDIKDYQNILSTLAQKYSLVLMDCDFDTEYGYFNYAQEIYLVQSFDILTIQPLTAFLRDLKSKNILNPEKLRIVLNKVLRVRSVTERTIIGGMAYYNDPAMSFMTELFNKDTVKYCTIPFEEQTYSRYLEGLVNCQISTNGYSKDFLISLDKLGNMVYPLLSNSGDTSRGRLNSYNNPNEFSSNMNATLNKMKNNY